jgi:chaperonin GroES
MIVNGGLRKMSVPVQPLAEYVAVQAEAAQTKTASGLYLPTGSAEKPKIAKVVAVGAGVKDVKVGDRVLYKNEYESTTVKVDNEEYVIVFQKNIVATIK